MLNASEIEAVYERCKQIPCVQSLGLELLEAGEGTCTMTARHDPRFDGITPGFHGGMLANVADCVAWFAVITQTGPDEQLVTTDLHIRYLNPCLTDVTARARVIKLGRTLCPVTVELEDAEGRPVAVAQVTYIRVNSLASPSS